jgi:hypothetical protein
MDVHLRSDHNDLFAATILLSGTAPICGVYAPQQYEVIYFKLLKEVGISADLPPAQRLAQLRAVSHLEISRATYTVFQGLDVPQFGISTDLTGFAEGQLINPSSYCGHRNPYKGRVIHGDCQRE